MEPLDLSEACHSRIKTIYPHLLWSWKWPVAWSWLVEGRGGRVCTWECPSCPFSFLLTGMYMYVLGPSSLLTQWWAVISKVIFLSLSPHPLLQFANFLAQNDRLSNSSNGKHFWTIIHPWYTFHSLARDLTWRPWNSDVLRKTKEPGAGLGADLAQLSGSQILCPPWARWLLCPQDT